MRYNSSTGKWQNDVMPEDMIGGKPYQYAQSVNNQVDPYSVSPGYYQTRPAIPADTAQISSTSQVAQPATAAASTQQAIAQPTLSSLPMPSSSPSTNQFSGQVNQYMNSSAPTPQQATMGTNRYAGGLTQAEQRLQDLINNPSSLQDSASYKFRVQQGQEALQRSLGAKGLLQSGNRLQELTKYGQDMGSQEYEAENARRKAMFDAYAGNYNTDQSNNINLYNAQQGSLDRQYATGTDAFTQKGKTLADLYGNENAANTSRYNTDVGAITANNKTLADLYNTNVNAETERQRTEAGKVSPQPWWTTRYDAYGRQLQA